MPAFGQTVCSRLLSPFIYSGVQLIIAILHTVSISNNIRSWTGCSAFADAKSFDVVPSSLSH
eukprot:3264415-Pyramimonas_sp.AAC.1